MSGFEDGVDPALRAEFLDEAVDGLDQVTGLFVELEADPDNPETIQAIFRPVHSIKGNAVYFGLLQTKRLAHEMETVLDLLRKGALPVSRDVTDLLLKGADELRGMLLRAREGLCETPDGAAFDELIHAVKGAAEAGRAEEEAAWRRLLAAIGECGAYDIVKQAEELARLTPAGRRATGAEGEPGRPVAEEPEPAKRLRAATLDAAPMPDPASVRNLLEQCRELASNPEARSIAGEAISGLAVLESTIGLDDPLSRGSLADALDAMKAAGGWKADGDRPEPARARGPKEAADGTSGGTQSAGGGRSDGGARTDGAGQSAGGGQAAAVKTMRIPEASIDAFLAHVGGLIMIGEMYSHLQRSLSEGKDTARSAAELRRANEAFNDLAHALQDSIMQIRRVPVNLILQKAPRMVRDIAAAKGKEIETKLSGGDLMIDKSLIDVLEAPLVHMVRNSADHGIEPPDERRASGKESKGRISISVEETPDSILMRVRDDGRGLNREALRSKAVELGMIPADVPISDQEVLGLLFKSGVSTAAEVTDVSGRGVGMDVVKRSIEGMGGGIGVSSEPGKWTEFSVKLPKTVTTEIIDGYVVIVGGKRYVLPLKRVMRCFRPAAADIVSVHGRGECVRDGEQMLPVSRLSDRFGMGRNGRGASTLRDGILVVVEMKPRPVAVHVDGIEGVRRVVLKEIDGLREGEEGLFLGGAVIGDGSVAMVVDLDRICGQVQAPVEANPAGLRAGVTSH